MQGNSIIRRMNKADIVRAANISASGFSQPGLTMEWLDCLFRAFPKSQCFVAEQEGEIVGLICWTEKSGFRKDAFVELEQIYVQSSFRRKGIGTQLIQQSLIEIDSKISQRGAALKNVIANTRSDNATEQLYKKTLNAQRIAVIKGISAVDEVYMVAKDVKIPAHQISPGV
jgi:GNAT superfamily N-acetyltransferase